MFEGEYTQNRDVGGKDQEGFFQEKWLKRNSLQKSIFYLEADQQVTSDFEKYLEN